MLIACIAEAMVPLIAAAPIDCACPLKGPCCKTACPLPGKTAMRSCGISPAPTTPLFVRRVALLNDRIASPVERAVVDETIVIAPRTRRGFRFAPDEPPRDSFLALA